MGANLTITFPGQAVRIVEGEVIEASEMLVAGPTGEAFRMRWTDLGLELTAVNIHDNRIDGTPMSADRIGVVTGDTLNTVYVRPARDRRGR